MNKPRSILFAEDSNEDVEMTLAALAQFGDTSAISVVRDGEEALEFLFRRGRYAGRDPGNPSLVLLDLKMPRLDGLEVLQAIKTDDRLRVVPVVMLTSSQEERDVVRSYELGANAYVVKPVGYSAFVQAINRIGSFWTLENEPPPGSIGRSA